MALYYTRTRCSGRWSAISQAYYTLRRQVAPYQIYIIYIYILIGTLLNRHRRIDQKEEKYNKSRTHNITTLSMPLRESSIAFLSAQKFYVYNGCTIIRLSFLYVSQYDVYICKTLFVLSNIPKFPHYKIILYIGDSLSTICSSTLC